MPAADKGNSAIDRETKKPPLVQFTTREPLGAFQVVKSRWSRGRGRGRGLGPRRTISQKGFLIVGLGQGRGQGPSRATGNKRDAMRHWVTQFNSMLPSLRTFCVARSWSTRPRRSIVQEALPGLVEAARPGTLLVRGSPEAPGPPPLGPPAPNSRSW
jgi:hypothetical protein